MIEDMANRLRLNEKENVCEPSPWPALIVAGVVFRPEELFDPISV